jgi:hypothetical protein
VKGRRRDGNHYLQKNNSIQDSVRNEENRYPVPDLNITMINITIEPNDTHTNPQRRKSQKTSHRNK